MTADQTRSLTATIIVHAIVAALLWFLTISSKNPPWEEGLAGGGGGGSFVEFGTLDFSAEAEVTPPPPSPTEEQPLVEEEIITSDLEETVSIPPKEKPKETPKEPVKEKPKEKTNPKATQQATVEVPKVELPKVNETALYKKRGGGNGGDGGNGGGGTGTGQGSGNGSGTGPGSGSGTGGGDGSGNGRGVGAGFDLAGRGWRQRPTLKDNSQETGKVVISIVVDKDGNVTSATGPARGSTNNSPQLYQKAKQAALQAKFTPSPDGVEEQRGTITFDFKLE